MLDVLYAAERALPALLQQPDIWQSKFVNDEHPYVERLWCSWGEYRISLHRIHPCERAQAYMHWHPWPSAMRIVDGQYEMGVGFGTGSEDPPIAATVVLSAGDVYEMSHPDGWHYVRPLGGPSLSVMVTGKPFPKSAHRESRASAAHLCALDPAVASALLAEFQKRYLA